MNEVQTEPYLRAGIPGTMMDVQLTIPSILEHVLRTHPHREVVARLPDGSLFRYTYRDFGARVAQLAHALVAMGIKPGDRVASFGWNSHRHLELYYAVPSIGAVLHTANIRLFPEQVCWAFEHADDKIVFADGSLAPAMARALALRPNFSRTIVFMGEAEAELAGALDYETLIAGRPQTFAWPDIDERSAAILCYTSATTGDPKGVAFTHRSTYIHALAMAALDSLGIRQTDTLMVVVPMFHVNAWGTPYAAPMNGAKLVFPGAKLDAPSLIDLIERERVTYSLGVPTVWLAVRDELEARDAYLPTLKQIVCGGSAVPPSLYDDLGKRGIDVVHAWGMTEMSPIGTMARMRSELEDLTPERRREQLLKQGTFAPIVAWKLLDDDGRPVPQDGVSRGNLWVRGPSVTGAYFKNATSASFADGWFCTGDVCTIDEIGYMQLVDRSKDLVKSGGEWISSVEVENHLMGHPAVREAAVIAVPHPKWLERPVAVVALREGAAVSESDLRDWLAERVAKWWLPDRMVFVDAIPRTGVGKFLKREMRERYADLLAE